MGRVKLESVHCVKDLGVTITSNLKFSQHCKEADLFSLEKLRLRGKLISVLKYLKGLRMLTQTNCFQLMTCHEGGIKLRCRQTQLDCTKFFFINDVVREWNKLSPSMVQCITVNSFRNKLDHHLLQQGLP